MKRVHPAAHHVSSRRLAGFLALSFALTIASFLLSRWVSESRARGIDAAASSITSVAAPAIERLSRARSELRHMEVLLGDVTSSAASRQKVDERRASFRRSRESFEHEWTLYRTLPQYPGERDLWTSIDEDKHAMDGAVESVLRMAVAGDLEGAAEELDTRGEPLFDRVDAELRGAIDLNASNAASLGARITYLRDRSRTLGRVLDALSAVFAATAAFIVIRLVRRFAVLMELRVSELEHFAGRVAHDIRSPLTSVGLALDLAKKSQEVDAKTKSVLDRGANTLQRVGQLVDGLLLFARAGAIPQREARADVQEVIRGVVDEMLPMAHERQIELGLDKSPPALVACDPGVLISLISNLIGNAIKYMGDASSRRIDVRVRHVGSAVRVEVQDTGPGVPKELQGRIFDPYVRGAESSVPGLGLGLATVRRLAEAHGGAVGVASDPSGSLFWFEIPKAAPNTELPVAG